MGMTNQKFQKKSIQVVMGIDALSHTLELCNPNNQLTAHTYLCS